VRTRPSRPTQDAVPLDSPACAWFILTAGQSGGSNAEVGLSIACCAHRRRAVACGACDLCFLEAHRNRANENL